MIELRSELEPIKELSANAVPLSFHMTFYPVYEKLKKWLERFPFSIDESIFSDLTLLYLLASKKFLDHRNAAHLFRVVLSMHLMQKKLLRASTFSPHLRHLEIRRIPTDLLFPFSNKPVLGCLIGFNLMDRYEMFDEENIVLALQKHLPQLRLVKESSYNHTSQFKNLKIFYFEVEKKNGTHFSFLEQSLLKTNLEEKVKKSIQPLSPTIFMGLNDEEMYKNILVLSQEIQSLKDLPQAYITLDQQTGKEIIFRINLVYITPFLHFSLKERFSNCNFVSQRVLTVRHLDDHPIEAHIFRIHLPRDPSFLRSDGSLDFYAARQKVVSLMAAAIGEFRDYNGGILIKQQEQLQSFKEAFPEIANHDSELLDAFFYAITPLEKQIVLPLETISTLFKYFLEHRKAKLPQNQLYSFNIFHKNKNTFIVLKADDSSIAATLNDVIEEQAFTPRDIAYNIMDTMDGVYFNCVLMEATEEADLLIHRLKNALHKWQQKMKERQILRVGMEYPVVSLDPRIGGEASSNEILRLLFEGLTRFGQNGQIENGVAESIEVSPDLKQYTFTLRSSFWNDGSPVTAFDFEYAWKKVLSPEFKTSFAHPFFPIKNAKEAKEGKIDLDEVGIYVVNDRVLKVELTRPTSYFLQETALPLFSPIHRFIDQQHPQWPYECDKNYPCNGPFQIKLNQPNQGYLLVKNPFYWEKDSIALDQISITHMNPAHAMEAFHKNQIDWVGNPFGGWHSFYSARNPENLTSYPNSWVCWCVFNTSNSPFYNHKLRQAVAYAIRREEIVENAYLPLQSAFSALLPHHTGNALFPKQNIEMARELWKEGLKELAAANIQVPTLSILFNEKGIQKYTASCLKKQLEECFQVECELKPMPWNAVFKHMTNGNFQIGLIHWTSWVDDPIYTLNIFKSSKLELSFPKWDNAQYQLLLDRCEQETDPAKHSEYAIKAEQILSYEKPIIPLFYQPYQALIRKGLNVSCRAPCGPFNVARSFYKKEII